MFILKDEIKKILIPDAAEAVAQAEAESVLFPDKDLLTDEFLKTSYAYKYVFGKYLMLQAGLDRVDDFLEKKGLIPCEKEKKEFYHIYDSMGLRFFYIRGIARVDRLSEEDLEKFETILNSDSDTAWVEAITFVSKTFPSVMSVCPKHPDYIFQPRMTLFSTFEIEGKEIPLALKASYNLSEEASEESRVACEKAILLLGNKLDPALSKDLNHPVKTAILFP